MGFDLFKLTGLSYSLALSNICGQEYQLWSSVLLEELLVALLAKNYELFYETRRFITVQTIANHLTLP
jgi:hypothetical protein